MNYLPSRTTASRTGRPNRRAFLNTTTKGVVAATGLGLVRPQPIKAAAANEKIGLGFIGTGGRAGSHLAGFGGRSDCEIVAVCDVNSNRLEAAKQHVIKLGGKAPQTYVDMHDLLADPSVDAVVVATPDHWHSPASIYACRAGKDVYVEKPVSNNPWEGRQLVEAARKYDRIVQVGTQNRSAPYNWNAKAYIESGRLGDVSLVRVYNQKHYRSFQMGADGDPPENLDWDRWQGPAPNRRFNATRFRHWHDFWDYAGGDVTNCGVHQLDLACMLLDINQHPQSIYSSGLARDDSASEMPDTLVSTFQFDQLVMTFHQTLYTPYMYKTDGGVRNGDMFPYWQQNATRIEIFGTEGLMIMGRHGGGWQVYGRPKNRQPVVVAQEYGRFPDREHQANFIESIQTRKRPNADIEFGHRSAALCHFANISFRTGNKYLELDADSEQFTNSEQANSLLKPTYRKPYVIAEEV